MAEVIAWEPMRRSPRLVAFLTYVVEAALRGDEGAIKAYSIAIDVFGRDESFDAQADPIVRVQARRLRQLLEQFYEEGHSAARVMIVVPRGRYAPQFIQRDTGGGGWGEVSGLDQSPAGAERWTTALPSRSVLFAGLVGLCILITAIAFWSDFAQRTGVGAVDQPRVPLLVVEEFENQTEDVRGLPLAAGLAIELVTDINLFADLRARYGGVTAEVSEADRALSEEVFVLSGVARRAGADLLYSLVVRNPDKGTVMASFEIAVPVGANSPRTSLQVVSTYFALRLGNPGGPVHAGVRSWLSQAPETVALDYYPCLAAFQAYRMGRASVDRDTIVACANAAQAAGHSEGAAMLGWLAAEQGTIAWGDAEAQQQEFARGRGLAEAAVRAEPLSAFNWAIQGHVALLSGDVSSAREAYSTAIQLNPAMVNVVADYALASGLLGNWDIAMALIEQAMSVEEVPPDFYSAVPALHALRNGDHARAVSYGERMAEAFPDLGPAVMVASGGHLRDGNTVNAYMPLLLASPRYRAQGIMPALRTLVSDPALLRAFSSGFIQAGMPLDRMAQPLE